MAVDSLYSIGTTCGTSSRSRIRAEGHRRSAGNVSLVTLPSGGWMRWAQKDLSNGGRIPATGCFYFWIRWLAPPHPPSPNPIFHPLWHPPIAVIWSAESNSAWDVSAFLPCRRRCRTRAPIPSAVDIIIRRASRWRRALAFANDGAAPRRVPKIDADSIPNDKRQSCFVFDLSRFPPY